MFSEINISASLITDKACRFCITIEPYHSKGIVIEPAGLQREGFLELLATCRCLNELFSVMDNLSFPDFGDAFVECPLKNM